jgi:sialate O-acetylesterase
VGRKGMSPISKDIPGFELAGKDRVFHPATARVDENDCKTIRVKSEAVPEPVAVRYAIRNYSNATLFNCFGVPASPFRSDDW